MSTHAQMATRVKIKTGCPRLFLNYRVIFEMALSILFLASGISYF